MPKSELNYFVTGDKWMRLPSGKLDKTDQQILKEAGKNVKVINMTEMLDQLQKEDPKKFEEFHQELNVKHGVVLTVPELYRLAEQGNEKKKQFDHIANLLTITAAREIRKWRVEEHLTWRAIARRATKDSNQLLGMAFCERAALMCGEDYRKDPWN